MGGQMLPASIAGKMGNNQEDPGAKPHRDNL